MSPIVIGWLVQLGIVFVMPPAIEVLRRLRDGIDTLHR